MQTTLNKYRKMINKKVNEKELAQVAITELRLEKLKAHEEYEAATIALETMRKVSAVSQEKLATHLSHIVTQAIQSVVQKPYEFVCEFVEKRGSVEADLYLTKEGKKFDIMDGTGGGLADVCSFALKVAYLLLSDVDRVLVIDEVSRHINGEAMRERFAEVLSRLAKEFKMQVILNTGVSQLLDICDNLVVFDYEKGQTVITSQLN